MRVSKDLTTALRQVGYAAMAVTMITTVSGCSEDPKDHQARLASAGPNPSLDSLLRVASVDAGKRKFSQCAACHSIAQGAMDRGGPNLYGVYGTRFGTNSIRFGYTAVLNEKAGTWDAPTLNAWMQDPQSVAPGTKMPASVVADPLDRADVIAYLKSLSEDAQR